ncbi:unnamed protein product [Hyaloperonospora brassicae]|uniref:Mannosylglycerate hydrolase MGH1-like glycoside hydrolase domain-containing protein n=1 Tax=Hyaloperonospora brassicae TaxID=162125 RepID=A0AAV0SYL8_HYABA|nr:unnamed protein product [Hyaloperonospora brassicae]
MVSATSLLLAAVCAFALVAAASLCDEHTLESDAMKLLLDHVDVELGGVGAGKSDVVGFQYLKPAEALLAAQAIAHENFTQATAQVQHILTYQTPDGLLPHLVYGSSVPSEVRWLASNRTFHPGPAFWKQTLVKEHQETAWTLPFTTSTFSAPPVAADVVWEVFRLAPYDSAMTGQTNAVQFLCHVYEPLKKLQKHLFATRRGGSPSGLLSTHHPWETFSSLSPHWKGFLAEVKKAPDYKSVVSSIPDQARRRFAVGASTLFSAQDAVENMYEPMIYLAAQAHRGEHSSAIDDRGSSGFEYTTNAPFEVEDVEFNALMLRSSLGLVNIGRVLVKHSSVCTGFTLTQKELLDEVEELQKLSEGLRAAIVGSDESQGLWNASADFFADSSRFATTAVHSLRGFLPAYAVELDDNKKMRSMKHFLSEPGSFSFFCARYPASFIACSGNDLTEIASSMSSRPATTTWMLYNYYLQRGFVRNRFPGLADYVRNKTRDMVCGTTAPAPPSLFRFPVLSDAEEPTPAVLSPAYKSHDGEPIEVFDDNYLGSILAAAALLNVLLPAATPPPSPDTPPIDHRILSVIMCVELVVAFGVAMSCFLFSVYFVANRPRQAHQFPVSTACRRSSTETAEMIHQAKLDHHIDDGRERDASRYSWADRHSESSFSDCSPRSGRTPHELEESLLPAADERYGSFNEAARPQTTFNFVWKAGKKVLAAISPW